MPTTLSSVSRRHFLVGSAALAFIGATPVVLVGCGPTPPPPELDDLVAQLHRAHADSDLAGLAATSARPQIAPLLTTVASERAAHARALADAITRLTAGATPTTSTPTSTTAVPATATAPATVADVVAALHASADSATGLAVRLSGYHAGLLGSIAAACAASYLVALADPERKP